jgi:hypothetical protein
MRSQCVSPSRKVSTAVQGPSNRAGGTHFSPSLDRSSTNRMDIRAGRWAPRVNTWIRRHDLPGPVSPRVSNVWLGTLSHGPIFEKMPAGGTRVDALGRL